MVAALPRGWAPASYGAVDVGANPAFAMGVVKGKDLNKLTVAQARALSQRAIDQVLIGVDRLRRKGLAGVDSPQFMVLTEDQTINGVKRRKGDVAFIDAANTVAETASETPQDAAARLLVVKTVAERFGKGHEGETIDQLQSAIPFQELMPLIQSVREKARGLKVPSR
jgi:hypothetical protein